MMGLRAKVICGFVLFFVIFGLRFLCANCQQVITDAISEDRIQPQMWQQSEPTELIMHGETSDVSSYQDPVQTWTNKNFAHRRRRLGARKRRRRPQGLQTTEINELNRFWQEPVEDEALNDSMILNIGKTENYFSSTIPNYEQSLKSSVKHFVRPTNRIERIREPLAALEQEQRLSEMRDEQRKKVTTESPVTFRDKSYRKPYSAANRQNGTTNQTPHRSGTDLKDILKNSGGLSLSEILQQKNLSLDDLIKGNHNALLALQTPATPIADFGNGLSKPVRRIPITYFSSTRPQQIDVDNRRWPEVELSTIGNDFNSSATIDFISAENITNNNELTTNAILRDNAPSRRLALNNFEGIRRIKPAQMEGTTAKTIHNKKYIEKSIVYQVARNRTKSTDTESPMSIYPTRVSYRKRLTIKPSYKLTTSESSSSSLEATTNENNKTQIWHSDSSNSEESMEDKLLLNEPETNIIEKFSSFDEAKPKDDFETIEELFGSGFRQENDSKILETITSRIDLFKEKIFFEQKLDVTESNPELVTHVDVEETVDDRTYLLELMEDRRSGGRLYKVLAQRNMTLDQLIEHRQRGSSQLHLSEIVQNKPGSIKSFSIRPQVLDEKLDIVTAFDNFPNFNLENLKSIKPDEIKTDSQGSSYFTSVIDMKPNDEINKEGRVMKSLTITGDLVEPLPTSFLTSGEDKSIDFYPQRWKTFALPVSYNSHDNYIDRPAEVSAQIAQPEDVDTYDPATQIEEEVARAHDLLDLELSGHGFRKAPVDIDNTELPIGMRSAIIASAIIVMLSLLIFLAIFLVCRWKQKRRKKLTYTENYNAIKTRLPAISRQSTMKRINTTTSPIIFPGSKNNRINTMDPNSPEVQEYLFDAMRKPF